MTPGKISVSTAAKEQLMRMLVSRASDYVRGGGLGPFLVRAVAGNGAVRIAAMAASFAAGVLLARGLGLEGYGYYSIALAVITIAAIPGELGLSFLVTREVAAASARKEYGKVFAVLRWADRACFWIAGAVALSIALGALIVFRTGSQTLAWALLLGAPFIPLITFAKIRGAALQGLNHVVLGQIPAHLIRPVVVSLLLAFAFFAGLRLTAGAAMALHTVSAATVLVVSYLWLRQRLPVKPPAQVEIGALRLSSSIPMGLVEGSRILQAELSILLLGFLTIPADMGLFRIAIVSATIAALPMTVIMLTTMPLIARLYAQESWDNLQKLLRYSAYAQTAGVALLALPLLIIPEFLLSFIFGPDFAAAADAMRIISLGQIANAAFGLNMQLLNMTHNESRAARAMGIGLGVNVATVLLFASIWGIAGAAIGFVIALLVWNVLTWLDARRILRLETSVFPAPVKALRD
jgi:O-antigen/teichoic acid export membrane protein